MKLPNNPLIKSCLKAWLEGHALEIIAKARPPGCFP
jgi:hypothetical protein